MSSFKYRSMNAILIIPAKFLAVFSKREKILRHSFNQPMSRSMMFLSRYDSRSKSADRLSGSWLDGVGITGCTPSASKYSSIQSARYPISPAREIGHAMRLLFPPTNSVSAATSSSSSTVDSCAWPAVRWKCNGIPLASQRRWIFVEKPPRERPNA